MQPSQNFASSDVSGVAQDFLVSGFGALTSIITAAILVAIDIGFNFSIYGWILWFVIPSGAIGCGFVAASGYYFGARLFNHRPTRVLLLNMTVISVTTFFLIHYFNYYLLKVDGTPVRDLMFFTQFLDLEISHTALRMQTTPGGSAVELGSLGFLYAALQILGFALGAIIVYFYLKSLAYCDACSKYLWHKGLQTRYTADSDGLKKAVQDMMQCFSDRRFQDGIAIHARAAGSDSSSKDVRLASQIEIKRCKNCNQHWLKFSVNNRDNDWKEIHELGYQTFCAEPITTTPTASAATSSV